jgi:hypothetical protein
MAATLKTEHANKRGEYFFVHPDDVTIVDDPAVRGRFRPSSGHYIEPERKAWMAENIFRLGQLEAIEVRKSGEKEYTATYGATRRECVKLIREGFTYEGKKIHDPDFQLKVTLARCSAEEAFDRTESENVVRNELTDMDYAVLQEIRRTKHGWSDADCARKHNMDASKVSRLKSLLELGPEEQNMVHEGKLTLSAAIALLKIPEADRKAAIKEALKESGKVNGAALRGKVRTNKQSAAAKSGKDETDDASPLSATDVRKYFETLAETEENDRVKEFAKSMLRFLAGKVGATSALNAIHKLAKLSK